MGVKVRLMAIQKPVDHDKMKNLEMVREKMEQYRDKKPDFVLLPEMFDCPYDNSLFGAYAEQEGEMVYRELSALAKRSECYLIGGSVPEKDIQGRLYNTSYVFGRDGSALARHRKVHLFDINVPGGQYFRESAVLSPGEQNTVFDTEFGKMGVCICFDLRFGRMTAEMAKQGIRILFVPAAFNMTTGPAHWELLFRSRAMDNQIFVLGCSPSRDLSESYIAYGHSILTDPWGAVVEELDEKPGILFREIDLYQITQVRSQIPIGNEMMPGH